MSKFQPFLAAYRAFGFQWAFSAALHRFFRRLGVFSEVQMLRDEVNLELRQKFSNTVAYGRFSGLVLPEKIWWGRHDVANKLLGQYESHVIDAIGAHADPDGCFIDIGAADGFFAVGVLKAGWFRKTICFEMSETGRAVVENAAKLNSVEDRIVILGEATEKNLREVIAETGPALVLCDIEGAEFDLISDSVLRALRDCTVIIELHDNKSRSGDTRRSKLLQKASAYFDISYVQRSSPTVHAFRELDELHDHRRLLLFSEGRPWNMEWVRLSPRSA